MSADPTYQIVDPTDPTLVLFDFNDSSGANNPYGLQTYVVGDEFNLNAPARDLLYFESDTYDGGVVAKKSDGLTESSFRMHAQASTIDNLLDGLGELTKLLDNPGSIKLQLLGSSYVRYLDYVDSLIPVALRGQERGLTHLQTLLRDPTGIPIVLMRQPTLRRARVSSADNQLVNGAFVRDSNGDGLPDAWTETDGGAILSGFAVTLDRFRMSCTGTSSASYVSQLANVGATCCLQIEARVVSGNGHAYVTVTDSTGGAETVSAQVTSRRFTKLTVPRTLAAGTQVGIRLKASNGGSGTTIVEFRMADVKSGLTPTPRVVSSVTVDRIANSTVNHPRTFPIFNDSDAHAPVNVKIAYTTSVGDDEFLAVRPVDSLTERWDAAGYLNSGFARQCETGLQAGMGTAVAEAGVGADSGTGAGNNVVEPPAALTSSYAVACGTAITSELDELRGSFDVFARVRKTVATDEIWVYLEHWLNNYGFAGTSGFAAQPHPAVKLPVSTSNAYYHHVFLGTLDVPDDETITGIQLKAYAKRVSGTGTTRFDEWLFVPRFFQTRLVERRSTVLSGDSTYFDSEQRRHKALRGAEFLQYIRCEGPTSLVVPPGMSIAYLIPIGHASGATERDWNDGNVIVTQDYQAREWL